MNVQEMIDGALMIVDKSADFQVASFEPEDVLFWLNESQEILIKQKAFGTNVRGEKYGQGIKRMEDLSPLVEYSARLDFDVAGPMKPHAYHPNVSYVEVKTHIPDYLYYVGADFLIQDPYAPTNTKPAETMLVEEEFIGKLIATPYNSPVLKNVYVYLKEGYVHFIYDPYAVPEAAYISYIKKPGRLVVSNPGPGEVTESILPEHVHQEIVALAASLMLENIESPRFQSNMLNLNKNE